MRILTQEIVGKEKQDVELAGWVAVRRDHGRIIFIDLRDRSGIAQLVFAPDNGGVHEAAERLRPEWVIRVRGTVAARPKNMQNPKIATGMVEVQVTELEVLNESETPPFPIDTDGRDIDEEVRLKYRYVDLRRERLTKNMRMRNEVIYHMRTFLRERGFVEIETPILSRSTPEGARDYVVPSRLHPGKFFALPQSPQQYKQLFMVAGFERYFQIARCFRDEDTRGDRQPEFTQLDLEMSFTNVDEVLALTEELYTSIVETLFPEHRTLQNPFPRLEYAEVMKKYGTDKPDLRKHKDDPRELAFAFIVNFPMFEWKEDERRWDAVHHPFTMPQVKDAVEFKKLFARDPAKMLAFQYDFVLNGYEIGGGSIRIHDPELLIAVFEAMGNAREDVEAKFGHMLRAFRSGVPPHGGIAPGIDRFVMVMMNEPNIREVIAFPKTGDGRDPMMGAPAALEQRQLDELHLKIKDK